MIFEDGEFFKLCILLCKDFIKVTNLSLESVVLFTKVLVGVLELLHDFVHAVIVDLGFLVFVLDLGEAGCHVGELGWEHVLFLLGLRF